jgi:hypothetical protein
MLSTAEGRDVFSYIVSCALPGDVTIVATVEGTTYEFPGGLGLAPRWLDKRLNKKGQRWVSACLFARVNLHDTAETISLRGSHEELALSPASEEAVLFTAEEGAFYGSSSLPKTSPSNGSPVGEQGRRRGSRGGLGLRDCTEPDPARSDAHALRLHLHRRLRRPCPRPAGPTPARGWTRWDWGSTKSATTEPAPAGGHARGSSRKAFRPSCRSSASTG